MRIHLMRACKPSLLCFNHAERGARRDPNAHPPRRQRWYFRIEYKSTAIGLKDGKITLSNGKGNEPLVLEWPWGLPKTVVIRWTGTQYEAVATYQVEVPTKPSGSKIAGIDLGEIHIAVSHDGTETHLLNGRLLRSKRQYQNKLKEHLFKEDR